jgi:hypothetical protein
MGRPMGFDYGLGEASACYKRKFRWMLKIPSISADGVNALPPAKAARPSISFKEMDVQHINETIYFPSKPEWKPLQVTLYDLKRPQEHPVWQWIKRIYDSRAGTWKPSVSAGLKVQGRIEMYDGCGETIETWVLENVWPQDVNFGELDMGASEIVTCDLALRYDRAYIE